MNWTKVDRNLWALGRVLVLALVLIPIVALSQQHPGFEGETTQQVVDALNQFHVWGNQQKGELLEICTRKDVDAPWTARLYDLSKVTDPARKEPPMWEENGYPRLALAVKAVESDFAKYPNGHVGQYTSR